MIRGCLKIWSHLTKKEKEKKKTNKQTKHNPRKIDVLMDEKIYRVKLICSIHVIACFTPRENLVTEWFKCNVQGIGGVFYYLYLFIFLFCFVFVLISI